MAKPKQLSAADGDVTAVWIAPEQLRAQKVQAAVDRGATAQDVADLAAEASKGEYREWLGMEVVEGSAEPQFGSRLRWVHPDGDEYGWFERVADDVDDYDPVVRPEQGA